MSDVAIRLENLGKEYHIGALQEPRYQTLRDQIARSLAAPFRRAGKLLRGQATGAAELDESIWALKDLSLEVRRGEVVGVIGHNGAGKSTLLKILSRITEPTEGYAEIHGRVGSLLEVGTGFHPELTGRENVYLNGAILGMTRAEIERKFDEIVAFSGVEKFIDTPVKHYSTGMGLRLAFAVAAHLDPEILIVDEVLAVGDAVFQQKCLGKMGEVAEAGRTVLLVSHNMGAITRLSDRALLLSHGRMVMSGDPEEVVATYLSAGDVLESSWRRDGPAPEPDKEVVLESVRVLGADGTPAAAVPFREEFEVEIGYRVRRPVRDLAILFGMLTDRGEVVWVTQDTDSTQLGGHVREPGEYVSRCTVPSHLLKPGRYSLNVMAHVPGVKYVDAQPRVIAFDVSAVGYHFPPARDGIITPRLAWTVRRNGG